MAQHTVDLPCIADTYIDREHPNTNYGSSTSLKIKEGEKKWEYRYDAKAGLRFNASVIPVRKNIVSASLKIYITNIYLTGSNIYFRFGLMRSANTGKINEYIDTYSNAYYSIYSDVSVNATALSLNTYNVLAYNGSLSLTLQESYLECFINAQVLGNISSGYEGYITFASRETANPPQISITYEDVPPNAPTPTEPIGAYKDSKSIIRFAWTYNSDVGGEQKAFDLQWSIDQSTWTTVSETTANNYYDMPAETFPAGNIYWRVRTYNEYDEVGPYCDIQSFYAIGAPNAPAINAIPTDTARPTVSWSAFSQQVYQLQVLSDDTIVYDSSVVPGINIRSHKINTWLADGSYAVKMRIKNEYDLWSEWSTTTVTISTAKPDKPSLTLQRSVYGVDINATGLIYRSDYNKDDYICIGTATGTFYDNAVVSGREYKYFVRAVSVNETYDDSDIKFIQAEFRHALIAPVTDLTNVFAFTRSLNAPPKRTYNRQSGGAMVQYAGRTHPVWEPDEHISAGLSLSFFLRAWAEVETFMTIYDLNSTVLYRDAKGRKIYGTLSNLSVNDDILGYIIGFTISQVDYNEEV